MRLRRSQLVVAALVLTATGCGATATHISVPGGDASRGAQLMDAYGCGACHTIAGIDGADADIGPPLVDFADRRLIAGRLPNNIDNLLRWIQHPQEVAPGTVMPDMGIQEPQARDLAAYLYSH
ncbi:MAG TPA: c-type cytochrome [Gaiella sp.]|nr:c-type cytochrome [Gaiella sp.]